MAEDTLDAVIVSDIHLGSEMSRARDALELLRSLQYRRLILLGDIFSDLNFSRLTGDHWKFLSCIRKLSNPKRKVEVVWVEGNHDHGLSNVMSHLVGVPVYQRYVWTFQDKRHVAIHGHQFDRFSCRNLLISRIGLEIYRQIQKIEGSSKPLSRRLDRLNTRWLSLRGKVAAGALHYAKLGRADRIFCGHTHQADFATRDGIDYYNTGAWVDLKPTYITVGEQGVAICEYEARTDDRYSREEREPQPAVTADLFEQSGLPAFAAYESLRC
jgi:UDP-2,3-diacylglucosamine pyrophosphatase LpxH